MKTLRTFPPSIVFKGLGGIELIIGKLSMVFGSMSLQPIVGLVYLPLRFTTLNISVAIMPSLVQLQKSD